MDEFSEHAMREVVGKMVLVVAREKPFLNATTRPEWMTLDGLVGALDTADYWSGEGWTNLEPPEPPPTTPAGKRKHVREMLEELQGYEDDEDPFKAAEKVFVSTFKATGEGGLERVFKVATLCSVEELRELREYNEAAGDYYHIAGRELEDARRALRRGEGALDLSEFYARELSEEAMNKAWPNIDEGDRGWVIAAGFKFRLALDKLTERLKREHEEGRVPTMEQAREHIRRGTEAAWDEVAEDLARGLGVGVEEAKRFVDQPAIRFYGSEFAEVLDNAATDEYGWTLDEHLRRTVDERELD